MSKVKHFFEQSWLLIISSFCFGLLIAVTNAAWSPRIEQNEKDKLNNLMAGLITEARNFEITIEDVQVPGKKGKITKTDIYTALDDAGSNAGFAFVATGPGFADKIKLVIAVDAKCESFLGFKVLSSNETPGFGDRIKEDYFGNQFKKAPADELQLLKTGDPKTIDSEIIAISGATVSSEAVVHILNTYIDKVKEQLQAKESTVNGK
ncbi:MAG: FMN-binding protein [Planctomycetota bacterium]|nr:MAG: FMN-binding protein [Planctomycetota bacterium]